MEWYTPRMDEKGHWITNPAYKEIFALDKMLTEANIPHTFLPFMDGYQVCYPEEHNRICDAIEHYGSYGHAQDQLELMGLLTDKEMESDSVLGGLTAKEVFDRIKQHYGLGGV